MCEAYCSLCANEPTRSRMRHAMDCDAELCPMWDGEGCPCETFGLDKDDLPTDGVFTTEVPDQ